jgi:hypothetical protein
MAADSQSSRPFDRLISHIVRNGSNRGTQITHARLTYTKVLIYTFIQ